MHIIRTTTLTFVLQQDVDNFRVAVDDGEVEGSPPARVRGQVNLLSRLNELTCLCQCSSRRERRSSCSQAVGSNQRRGG